MEKFSWLKEPLIAAAICIPLSYAIVNLFTNKAAVSCHENGGLWSNGIPNHEAPQTHIGEARCYDREPQ